MALLRDGGRVAGFPRRQTRQGILAARRELLPFVDVLFLPRGQPPQASLFLLKGLLFQKRGILPRLARLVCADRVPVRGLVAAQVGLRFGDVDPVDEVEDDRFSELEEVVPGSLGVEFVFVAV